MLPGPSAVETSLVASGLLADEYRFIGYLPRRDAERRALAEELVGYAGVGRRVRVATTASGVARGARRVDADRPAAVCRELTKRFEEVAHGTVAELAERFAEPPRGEITVVLGPRSGAAGSAGAAEAEQAVAELVAAGVPRRQAVDIVARLTGVPRNALYRASL